MRRLWSFGALFCVTWPAGSRSSTPGRSALGVPLLELLEQVGPGHQGVAALGELRRLDPIAVALASKIDLAGDREPRIVTDQHVLDPHDPALTSPQILSKDLGSHRRATLIARPLGGQRLTVLRPFPGRWIGPVARERPQRESEEHLSHVARLRAGCNNSASPETQVLDSLLSAFGGPGAPFLYVLTALAAYGLTVTGERGWWLSLRWARLPQAASDALESGDSSAAASAAGDHPAGAVLQAGGAQPTAEAAWEAMGVASVEAEQAVRRRVGSLSAIGNLATMIGLLGTVYGLMLAFSALGDATAGERAAKLSEGIATAMATTACGLLVAIPCLAAHAWLEGRADAVMAQVEAAAGRLALSKRSTASAD